MPMTMPGCTLCCSLLPSPVCCVLHTAVVAAAAAAAVSGFDCHAARRLLTLRPSQTTLLCRAREKATAQKAAQEGADGGGGEQVGIGHILIFSSGMSSNSAQPLWPPSALLRDHHTFLAPHCSRSCSRQTSHPRSRPCSTVRHGRADGDGQAQHGAHQEGDRPQDHGRQAPRQTGGREARCEAWYESGVNTGMNLGGRWGGTWGVSMGPGQYGWLPSTLDDATRVLGQVKDPHGCAVVHTHVHHANVHTDAHTVVHTCVHTCRPGARSSASPRCS